MAHESQQQFFRNLKTAFPLRFKSVRVLDCGSMDVNGSLRELFCEECNYTGLDKSPGKNVDAVSLIHEFSPSDKFDLVVSASTLEHDEYWRKSLENMYALLKPGGFLAVSTVCGNFPEHGTEKNPDAENVYGTSPGYYKNLSAADILGVLDRDGFQFFSIEETENNDLFFYGVKK